MVLVYQKKPVLDDDNMPSEYWVKYFKSPTNPVPDTMCIGYYCPDANGKYTEPCDDGTCRDSNGNCKPKEEPAPTKKTTKTTTKTTIKNSQLVTPDGSIPKIQNNTPNGKASGH